MNKNIIISLAVFSLIISSGCATQKQPQTPSNACEPCWNQMKETGKEYADKTKTAVVTGTIIAMETTDVVLEGLQKAEKYLQEKIEQFKINHPEMVAEAELQLQKVRDRIAQMKREFVSTH